MSMRSRIPRVVVLALALSVFGRVPTDGQIVPPDGGELLSPDRAQPAAVAGPDLLAAGLAPLPAALADDRAERRGGWRTPHLARDASLIFGGAVAYAMARNKHRGRILGRGSPANVFVNFRDPIGRAVAGTDEDSFLTNYVAHPVTWGGIALYLKYQGYSDLEAFALSQAHSVFWEYVVEGSYTTPSGRDVVTNFFSAAAFVYVFPLVTGDLFPEGDEGADPGDGPRLGLAPPVAAGAPGGPALQLGLELRWGGA